MQLMLIYRYKSILLRKKHIYIYIYIRRMLTTVIFKTKADLASFSVQKINDRKRDNTQFMQAEQNMNKNQSLVLWH